MFLIHGGDKAKPLPIMMKTPFGSVAIACQTEKDALSLAQSYNVPGLQIASSDELSQNAEFTREVTRVLLFRTRDDLMRWSQNKSTFPYQDHIIVWPPKPQTQSPKPSPKKKVAQTIPRSRLTSQSFERTFFIASNHATAHRASDD